MSHNNADDFRSIAFGVKKDENGFTPIATIKMADDGCMTIKGNACREEKDAVAMLRKIHEGMEANWEETSGFPWPFDGKTEYAQ